MTARKDNICQACGVPCRFVTCGVACREQLRRDRVCAEVEHLLGSDDPESIAARVGYTKASRRLISMLRDEGRHDLADRLSRQRLGHIPQGRVRALIH